jgi:3-oxoadipate enol-lactonase
VPGPYTMEMLPVDCRALLDAFHIDEPVILCGLSMGGYISLAFLRQFPSQVAGLILAATRVGEIRTIMSATSIDGIVGALNSMQNRIDSTPMLPLIEVPTLLVHGAEDQLIPLSVAQDMHTAFPGSTLASIPGAGHLLNLEQPVLFNRVVEKFLFAHAYGK